jgi:hypothetical protein
MIAIVLLFGFVWNIESFTSRRPLLSTVRRASTVSDSPLISEAQGERRVNQNHVSFYLLHFTLDGVLKRFEKLTISVTLTMP